MDANLITDHAGILAYCLADAAPVGDGIETGDTIRYTGKRQHWTVSSVDGDVLTVWTSTGNRRGVSEVTRTVRRDRIELVRKGNAVDDALAAFEANGGTWIGIR